MEAAPPPDAGGPSGAVDVIWGLAMDDRTLQRFRERLQRRRREIVENRHAAERGVEEVRDGRTDPEYEESAQADHVAYTLEQLSDAQRREVELMDAALARIDAGSYGICMECGVEISEERLNALPFALRCAECATREEQRGGLRRSPATM